jgi:DMSO/TMAO reductase YedYZ molybdopterin-dependent catalytic subunit
MLVAVTERASPPSIEEGPSDGSTPRALGSGSERSVGRMEAPGVGAAIGLVAGGVAIGVAHLLAGILNPQASPVITVGQAAIDATPEWLKSWAIRTFGENDKAVLVDGIYLVVAVVAIALGILSIRRPQVAIVGLAVFGTIGMFAALTRPNGTLSDAVPAFAGFVAGTGAFLLLRRTQYRRAPHWNGDDPRAFDRRRFLVAGGAGAIVAVVAGATGNVLGRRFLANASRADVTIPLPASPAMAASGTELTMPGLEPFFTPNDRFYRVDTALLAPAVMAEDWRLRIHGMVDRELTIGYRQLLERPLIERDVTLTCVSNTVGGRYAGNARWIGAPLADLLLETGIHPGADQIVSRSVDGFTVGTPTAIVMDGRDAMLAVAMNGEPLPIDHGFPVRMIVPGLYGYVSATKWVVDIELTTFDAFDPYWVQRGWAEQAPIKTTSRIDTPRPSAAVRPGTVPVAGVAWAQHRGIERVELRVDEGSWMIAQLAAEDTIDTWRQWVVSWDATPGDHRLQVRATDLTGMTQPEARMHPFPNGATGWHTVVVKVT